MTLPLLFVRDSSSNSSSSSSSSSSSLALPVGVSLLAAKGSDIQLLELADEFYKAFK